MRVRNLLAGTVMVLMINCSTPVYASSIPPLPPMLHGCIKLASDTISCRDHFGNNVNCVLRQVGSIVRWSCHG